VTRREPKILEDTGCKILRCWVQAVAGAKMLGAKTASTTIKDGVVSLSPLNNRRRKEVRIEKEITSDSRSR
jgi:hypothetical protein